MSGWISPDCAVNKHVACSGDAWDADDDVLTGCDCFCHAKVPISDDVMALPTAPGVTVLASDVTWACPTCGEDGVGERSLMGHAERHISEAHVVQITSLELRGLSFLPGALTVREPPQAGG